MSVAALPSFTVLQEGAVLKRPLFYPGTERVMLASGATLDAARIAQLQRLGVVQEALACLDAPTPLAEAPVKLPPAPPAPADLSPLALAQVEAQLQSRVRDLHQHLALAFSPALGEADWGPLSPAREAILAILQRMGELPAKSLAYLQAPHCGELTRTLNVFLFCTGFAVMLDLPQDEIVTLTKASLLHDLGKRRLEQEFADRRFGLTPAQRRMLDNHVQYTLRLVQDSHPDYLRRNRETLECLEQQAERWDGNGPLRRVREAISLPARLLALGIRYVELTTEQPGKPAPLAGDAYQAILAEAGRAFDPKLVSLFAQFVRPYPPGAVLELSNGQKAQVFKDGKDPYHPVVQFGFGEEPLDLGLPGMPTIVRAYPPRRHARRHARLALRIAPSGDASWSPAESLNLSEGGLALETGLHLTPGDAVNLELTGGIACAASVAWAERQPDGKVRAGLSFHPLSAPALEALRQQLAA